MAAITPEVCSQADELPAVSVAIVADKARQERLGAILRRISFPCVAQTSVVTHLSAATDADAVVTALGSSLSTIVESFKQVRAVLPDSRIVGLWPDGQWLDKRLALKAGADGLVMDSQADAALGPTLRAVCSGLVCFPRKATAARQADALSVRERQVLGMLIMGFTNADIGRRLFLAESTVKSHLSSAYLKLGVRSRKDAAALILDPDEGLGTKILAIQGD